MNSTGIDHPEQLYTHWEELKLVEYIPQEKFDMIEDNPIRDAFVKVLRKGINERGRQRHSLNLKEILPLINDYLGRQSTTDKIKLTALYHHRDKLLEGGFIEEVATILEGKRYTTYYGRTAKGFILGASSQEKQIEKKEDLIHTMQLTLHELDPSINNDEIENFLDQYFDDLIDKFEILQDWIRQNEVLMQKSNIDIIDLMDFMQGLLVAHPSIIDQTTRLGALLKLPGFSRSN